MGLVRHGKKVQPRKIVSNILRVINFKHLKKVFSECYLLLKIPVKRDFNFLNWLCQRSK